jgi:hypothetical protein
MKITDINATTNEVIEREMNANELAQYEADQAANVATEAEAAAKAHERSALLAKLGITEEEAALLLGGN